MSHEYTLSELAEVTGMPERTLRLYRTRGLLDPPVVRGRVGYFGQRHLAQLRMVKALVDRGLPLGVIASLTGHDLMQVEIAHVLRSMLTSHDGQVASRSTLDPQMVSLMDRQRPGVLEELVRTGVMTAHDDGSVEADSLLLALVNALYPLGIAAGPMGTLGVRAGQLAEQYAEGLEPSVAEGLDDDERRRLVIELATSAFREALSHALRR